MDESTKNYVEIQNFLDAALSSSGPNSVIEDKAVAIFRAVKEKDSLSKKELLILIRLQLLLQKLCKFDLAIQVRDLLPLVMGVSAITKSKIQIDNLTLPPSAYSLLPSTRSKSDFLSILSIIRLIQTLEDRDLRLSAPESAPEVSGKISSRISGKKIAIVGPASLRVHRGSEIDGYDVVVRMNIKGDKALPDFNTHGKRTDVLYLNGIWTSRFEISNYRNLLASNCHFVWRTGKGLNGVANSHSLLRVDDLELSGSYLMLPRVILDLLRFNPASISVFQNDFYAGEKIYEENFRSERNAKDIWHLADHDLLTSLRFINLLAANSRAPINFVDLEFGETSLNLESYSSLIQRRNLN